MVSFFYHMLDIKIKGEVPMNKWSLLLLTIVGILMIVTPDIQASAAITSFENADDYDDMYYEQAPQNIFLYELYDDGTETIGQIIRCIFLICLALFIPVQLLKTKILGDEQRQFVSKARNLLFKIHMPIAFIGVLALIGHATLAFYTQPYLSWNHITGIFAAILCGIVIVFGFYRKKQKHIGSHLIFALIFLIAFLIHSS